jgi:YaiO family outer membrane protein
MPLWITHTPVPVRGAAALSGWAALSIAALLWIAPSARADTPACATVANAPANGSPAGLLAQARELAIRGDYSRARGLLEWLLARYPQDRDARLALARTDAWEHCYTRAGERYRALISEKPDDPEARAALIDLLLWQNERAAAEQLADEGLARAPKSAELWARRARLYLRDDDPARALTAADRALVLSHHAPEYRRLRDSIYLTQLRFALRVDAFTRDYPNLYTAFLQLWHRIGRVELTAEASEQDRTGGALPRSIIDGLYTLGASYHIAPILTFGGAFGFGAPAQTLPRWTGRVWASSQVAAQWSASLAYSQWHYDDQRTVHIFAPIVSFTPDDAWMFDLRWWITCLVLGGGDGDSRSSWVNSIGVRALRVLTESVRLGASYTFGPQLDRGALTFDFARTTSHVFAVYADYRPLHSWGLQPYLGFEHRSTKAGAVLIYSAEAAAYMRW